MPQVNIQLPKRAFNFIYLPYLGNDSRYLIFYGGAGSGKSYFIAERYIKKLLECSMCNILVARAVGNTNRDSTYALFKQVIGKWSLGQYFKFGDSDLRVKCTLNNNEVVFKGLDDPEKLKSITFAKGELTDIWIEEASEIDEPSFNQLDVRLRGKGSKKQIVISFNPIDVNHWLKKRFFDRKDNNITWLHTTYKDNRFLDDDYTALLEGYKDTDPYYYTVYCLGQWGVYGKTIFDKLKVSKRIADNPQPGRAGRFEYDYDEVTISNIRWIEDKDGYIKIYQEPKPYYPYVIGGDTAGDGSDYFTGQVLDNTTGAQAAVFKNQFDEDLYAHQLYCLGMHYNTALIGPEANFSTHPIKELERLRYPKLYVREREDTFTGGIVSAYGFKTTSTTRPLIISELVAIVRDHPELVNDIDTLEEMLTFVRNEKGRPEAQKGAHDDLIMGLAIAHYIRQQQKMTVELPCRIGRYTPDLLEDWKNGDAEIKKMMEERYGKPY